MTDQFENGRGKGTVSDEDWARILGEAPEDIAAAANRSQKGKTSDLGAANGTGGTGKAEGAGAYKVGRGKPPKEHQFKPGHSGNLKGAPKGKGKLECQRDMRDMRAIFMRAAMTPVTTMVGGRRTKKPALEAMYLRLFARAIEGHGPSMRFAHTVAREDMAEHEEWQVIFFNLAQGLIEELENQPEDKKDRETKRLLNELFKRVNAKITDEL